MPANKANISAVCKQCGREYLTWKYRIDRGQDCCSHRCASDHHKTPAAERFNRYLSPPDENGCINWTGSRSHLGYGRFSSDAVKTISTHRFAWEQANGPIPGGLCVLHRCDNPICCNPEHLFLGTDLDNKADCCDKQRQARGSKHGQHKLTEESVKEIRDRYASGANSQDSLASEFGVKQQTISKIIHRKMWAHV